MAERRPARTADPTGALLQWAFAALKSAERVLEAEKLDWASESDALLMLLALRNVVRAGEWLAVERDDEVSTMLNALELFEAELPGLVTARDVIEHFDEYAVGKGRLQRKLADPPTFPLFFEYGGPGAFVVHVGALNVDVLRARDACRGLTIRLLAAVEDSRERAVDATEE